MKTQKKKKLVVLTGAGISAESGLRTFRDGNGLWENYKIEDVATPKAWKNNWNLVLEFYNLRRRDVLNAYPNDAHKILAELESFFHVQIITQNIDDLHERAGSKNVLHLHGEILKMRSENDENYIYPCLKDIKPGDLAKDGFQLRPHVVWFEEPVPKITNAISMVKSAEVFLIVGSSLLVYPAAGLIDYLSPQAENFIIDKSISGLNIGKHFTAFELPATEGLMLFKEYLLKTV